MTDKNENSIRALRKDEHVKCFLEQDKYSSNGFEDIKIQNNSIPDLNFSEINTACSFINKTINFPLIINAMTGGTAYTQEINHKLAMLAEKFNIPIAVGSQTVALRDPQCRGSFKIVRSINKNGIVIANLSAQSSYKDAAAVVEMIQADAVQLHLNVPQEMCMEEGDRSFKGTLENIQIVSSVLHVPVIVKETGFGMSYEAAKKLYDANIKYIDIGGKGGTNFAAIESARNKSFDSSFLIDWGIPTALSLLECVRANKYLHVICSGGITKSEEIVKALVMGADLVGMSGKILKTLLNEGYEQAEKLIEGIMYETKVFMLLLGVRDMQQLRKANYQIKGEIRELYKNKFL